ncbi:MAG: hypothetical protein IJU71_11695, partial [Selenomonadaceae bacterium]|nr:hypothetical protein [Selenomonadaceae bacterium]
EHDVLKGGLPIYHIDWRIDETGEKFGAGSHIIYVNGENRDESALGRLMQDFFAQDPNQMHDSILQRRAQHFKSDNMGVSKMSTIMQDIYDGARLEGIALGREEGRKIGREIGIEIGREEIKRKMICNLLKHNRSVEFIAQIADCPVEKVIEIAKAEGLIK